MRTVRIFVQVVRWDGPEGDLAAVENQRELQIETLTEDDDLIEAAVDTAPRGVVLALREIGRERLLHKQAPINGVSRPI